jgi:predicted transcriptional regulator
VTENNSLELTADIVSAFAANNYLSIPDLLRLIPIVHSELVKIGTAASASVEISLPREPAVAIKKSISADFIICLEDGEKFKSLKRHLRTAFGLTPDQYRAKWGLPSDYPMVAPNYSVTRSKLAKRDGLGRKSGDGGGGRAKTPTSQN